MSKVKIEGNASGTGILTIAAPNTNSDRTLTLPDSAGEIVTASGGVLPALDGSNLTGISSTATAIAFQAYGNTGQSISSGVKTVIQYNNEELDTHNLYDTSTYRFTPNVEGWYWMSASCRLSGDSDQDIYDIKIEKNGVTILDHSANQRRYTSNRVSGLVYFNGTTDYATGTILINTAFTLRSGSGENVFSGFLVRSV